MINKKWIDDLFWIIFLGDPAPTMFWIQPSGISRRYEAPADEDARNNEGVLVLTPDAHNDLSGMYICLAYNEAGNVTLTMNVSWPAKGKATAIVEGTSSPDSSTHGDTRERDRDRNHKHNHNHKSKNSHSQADSPGNANGNRGEDISTEYIDIEDGTKGSKKDINAVAKGDKSYTNFTALNMMDLHKRKGDKLFNLTELIGAIIGTHVCTLLLCLIFMPIYLKRQWKKRWHQKEIEKNPNERLYLNGRTIPDYLDTPPMPHKR